MWKGGCGGGVLFGFVVVVVGLLFFGVGGFFCVWFFGVFGFCVFVVGWDCFGVVVFGLVWGVWGVLEVGGRCVVVCGVGVGRIYLGG